MRHFRNPFGGWLLLAILPCFGAGDPAEVVKIRVQASKVASWFPAGTALEILPADQFDELLKAASKKEVASNPPRILRARHSARLDSGVLIGRSEFTVETDSRAGSRLVVLDPWSPALVTTPNPSSLLRVLPDGRLALRVDPTSPRTFETEWRLNARPGSDGRLFALALPDLEMASLTLDLPVGWVPEAKGGPRVGPEPGSTPGQSRWRFDSASGVIPLRLRNPADDSTKPGAARLWLEGTTRIDLSQGPTNWRADWTLEESPGSPQRLTVELDNGLELVEVSGPRIASFREESAGTSSRVTIHLDGPGSGSSVLTIKGITQPPPEGVWSVPTARPIDAVWTGGRTLVSLDPSRVLQSCVERSGRRVAPRPSDTLDLPTLIFEGNGEVGPLADLTLRRPTADATVDIRGHLILGDAAPKMKVALTWMVERGRLLTHAVDLSPGWVPDGVLSGMNQPIPWHAEPLGNAGTRVHIGASPADDNALMMTLTLTASAPKAGSTGLLDLPRVRPAPGVRVVDEVWAATLSQRLSIQPIKGEGLAWIDPLDPPLDDVPAPWVADDLKNALAWRWLADDAEARINRSLPLDRPRAGVMLDASILNGRLGLKWTIAIDPDQQEIRSIPIQFDQTINAPIHWRTRGAAETVLEARPIDEPGRAKLGFLPEGSAWELQLSNPLRARTTLEATLELPWTGKGRIPILRLPERYRAEGRVSITTENKTRLNFDSTGLTPLDPSNLAGDSTLTESLDGRAEDPRTRQAALFSYDKAGGRLVVESIGKPDDATSGLIREAFLVSHFFPGAGLRHRLSLKVAGLAGQSIHLKMPVDAEIDRIRRDGQPIAINELGDSRLRIDSPESIGPRVDFNLTIDYRTNAEHAPETIHPADVLPSFSLPCLSFQWEIVTPQPWDVAEDRVGLVSTDLRSVRSMTARLLGFSANFGSRGDFLQADSAMLADLDRTAEEFSGAESELGNWLLKLDGGRWPVVIDRLALRSMGWGPSTKINLTSPEVKTLGSVKGVLQPLGLSVVPLRGMFLITGRSETPERPTERSAYSTNLQRVPEQGSDETDRFQSASRWRGEASPRVLAAGESADRSSATSNWHSRRLVASGWPNSMDSVRFVNRRVEQAWGWFIASCIFAGGILSRNRPARARGLVLGSLGLIATISVAWNWPEPPAWSTGLIRGALALSAFWVGRSFRTVPHSATELRVEDSTRNRQSRLFTAFGSATVIIATSINLCFADSSKAEAEAPILALLVFDGVPDATSKPDRVILSIADAERLRQIANPPKISRPTVVSLLAASHVVARQGPHAASVESLFEMDVESTGDSPAKWSIPVGSARDFEASIDGKPVPVSISADGTFACVALSDPGKHRIMFQRTISLKEFGQATERLLLPINRAAFTRISVKEHPETQRVEVPEMAGAYEVGPDSLSGEFGPSETLDIRWVPAEIRPTAGFEGAVETAILWDARPTGDLIRLRLTHSDAEGASTIRLGLGPGLIVRRHSIPNVESLRIEGSSENPEWVARVSPPLPKDQPVEIECWRGAGALGSPTRRWPAIRIFSTGKVNQILALRRPIDFSGRLDPDPKQAIEAISEINFLKSWGPLDDDGMSLAGAVRFNQPPALDVVIRPLSLRRKLDSKVQVELVQGRLDLTIDATLTDIDGRSFELGVGIPNDLRLLKVEATGLVDWQKVGRDRLRLQFDGADVRQRSIRIVGSVSVPSDSMMTESRSFQARIPWPRWIEVEVVPSTLVVSGPTPFQVEVGEGVVRLPPVNSSGLEPGFRSAFRVDRPTGLSTIRWSAPRSRLAASVRSDLTIDAVSASWSSTVVYEIAGGPADSLQWDLPTDWAKSATLEIEGHSYRIVAEPKGTKGETTRWTILPGSPLWGQIKLVLRSRRPIEPGVAFNFPDVAPLAVAGRGSVEHYELAITNLSHREIRQDRLIGLLAIDPSGLRLNDSLNPSGSIKYAYQVTGGRWTLGLVIGRVGQTEWIGDDSQLARVAAASVWAVVNDNGEIWGHARYDLEARPGPFCRISLTEPSEIPWSVVDGTLQPALRDGSRHWLIPLGDRRPRRIDLIWHRPSIGSKDPSGLKVDFPGHSTPGIPTLATIYLPPRLSISELSQPFERIDEANVDVERAITRGPTLIKRFVDLDRESKRDLELLIEEVVDLELLARKLSRTQSTTLSSNESGIVRVKALMTSIDEACENNGHDGVIQEAEARVGLVGALEDPSGTSRSNLGDRLRIRRIGVPTSIKFRTSLADPSLSVELTRKSNETEPNRLEPWSIIGVGFVLSLAFGVWISRTRTTGGRLAWAVVLIIVSLGLAWEPLGIMGTLGLVALGRKAS